MSRKEKKSALQEEVESLWMNVGQVTAEQKKECLDRLFGTPAIVYKDHLVCSHCGHVIPGKADSCPCCGAELKDKIFPKDFSNNMYLHTKFAAKYDAVTNPDTGHVFHVETVYACYLQVDRCTDNRRMEAWLEPRRRMAMCYQNWYYQREDGKIVRGVISARIKMNPSYTYNVFSVGPWCGKPEYKFRRIAPHRNYYGYYCGYYNEHWDLNVDTVIESREETDWFNAWYVQQEASDNPLAVWM